MSMEQFPQANALDEAVRIVQEKMERMHYVAVLEKRGQQAEFIGVLKGTLTMIESKRDSLKYSFDFSQAHENLFDVQKEVEALTPQEERIKIKHYFSEFFYKEHL